MVGMSGDSIKVIDSGVGGDLGEPGGEQACGKPAGGSAANDDDPLDRPCP